MREDVLERDYCLAWFLTALAQSDLREILAFKGGTALKRCYFGDYRFSEDLYFTLIQPVSFEDLRSRLAPVYEAVRDGSGIRFTFDREDRQKHSNSYTFYLKYEGPLPAPNDVKVDITIRETIVFPLEDRPVLRGYDEFSDVPETRLAHVYSLNEIATEKLAALADRARNEPRDLYDLWYLTTQAGVELVNLTDAIRQKLSFRSKPFEGLEDAVLHKERRLDRLWSNRLAYQMARLPPFEGVFRAIRRELRQARLP